MANIILDVKLQCRNDTASNWTSNNPKLLKGEFGYENDTSKLKIGDGVNNWNNLAYLSTGGGSLPEGGLAGQVLISNGSGGATWGWIGNGKVYVPSEED